MPKSKPGSKNSESNGIRLQKYISECGIASRRKAEELIQAGKVRVNGQIVTQLGTKINPERDRIQVRNRFIQPAERGIILFNKPRHVVATMSDPEGRPCVADYLTSTYRNYYPVGRLDFESTGLMILTNDGELAERLMHPRYGFPRTYEVKVWGQLSEEVANKARRGIKLDDGLAKADIDIFETRDNATWLRVVIAEGRNRLIRRMMDKLGHGVIKLNRISHGPFKLSRLKPGALRKLTQKEYESVRRLVVKKVPVQNRNKPSH